MSTSNHSFQRATWRRKYVDSTKTLRQKKTPSICDNCTKALTTYAPSTGAFATPTSGYSRTSRNQEAMRTNRWTFGAIWQGQEDQTRVTMTRKCQEYFRLTSYMLRIHSPPLALLADVLSPHSLEGPARKQSFQRISHSMTSAIGVNEIRPIIVVIMRCHG